MYPALISKGYDYFGIERRQSQIESGQTQRLPAFVFLMTIHPRTVSYVGRFGKTFGSYPAQ
jgi:hypothetical protein